MATQSQSESANLQKQTVDAISAISVCETRPGRLVFLEAGNTDGWIATDTTEEINP